MVERILEALLIVVALRAGALLVGVPWGDGAALRRDVRARRRPVAALTVTAVLVAGLVLELVWPGALHALGRHGAGYAGWQVLTAPFVQEGIAGGIFNVVSALAVLALAEWAWGSLSAAAIWLLGAWAPIGAVAGAVGYHVSQAHEAAYSAGSSGATYFTAGTLCAAVLITRAGRVRWLGAGAAAIAALMWFATDDGHGVLLLEGVVLGGLLTAARARRVPAAMPTAMPTGTPTAPAAVIQEITTAADLSRSAVPAAPGRSRPPAA